MLKNNHSQFCFIWVFYYSSSSRFLAMRSPPVTAARSASPSEALDCFVPVFGNSFAPAFLAGAWADDSLVAYLTTLLAAIVATDPSAKVTTTDPSVWTWTSVAVGFATLTAATTFAFSSSVSADGL